MATPDSSTQSSTPIAEFANQTYISSQLFANIYHSSLTPEDIQRVVVDCRIRLNNIKVSTGSENKHYSEFKDRLNAVKDSLQSLGLMKDSIYNDVKFEVYDRLMFEGGGTDARLKPDLLARTAADSTNTTEPPEYTFWESVEFCVEMKDTYSEMVAQGATYARSISYSQRGREFVLVIFFDQKTSQVSFGLFSSALLCLSHKFNIRDEKGQEDFIKHMAQVWTCNSRWSAGFDDTCNNVQCCLEKFGTLSFRQHICYRNSLRGRRTRVDILDDGEIWTDDLPVQNKYLETEGRRADVPVISHTNPPPSKLPIPNEQPTLKRIILKDSWPLAAQANREMEVFGVEGQDKLEDSELESETHIPFGLCHYLGSYIVKSKEGLKSSTASRFPGDMSFHPTLWREERKSRVVASQPEERLHVRLLIGTEGVSLVNATSPRQLLQAILHAILGYSIIFKWRWLHRDISIGNVLLMKTPQKRRRIQEFPDTLTEGVIREYFDSCLGFLIDGDQAEKWDRPGEEHATQRSGTPPFMSCYSLLHLNSETPHTVLDDLESFIWVFLWAILSVMRSREVAFTREEALMWQCLTARDLNILCSKRTFPDILGSYQASVQQQPASVQDLPSSAFAPFVNPLVDWFDFAFSKEAVTARITLNRAAVDKQEETALLWIEKYLSSGIKHLKDLPDNWDYIS